MDQVQNDGRVQCNFAALPERIILLCILGRRIFYEIIDHLHHVLVIMEIGKGIEAVGMLSVDKVKDFDNIAFFQQKRRD